MKKEKFEHLVEEALEQIPEKFIKLFDNIIIQVEDRPPKETYKQTGTPHSNLILGTYHGVPLKHRGPYYGNTPPDVITIYQEPIEKICRSEEDIREKIKEVVRHEVGHYFGMKHKELDEIEGR